MDHLAASALLPGTFVPAASSSDERGTIRLHTLCNLCEPIASYCSQNSLWNNSVPTDRRHKDFNHHLHPRGLEKSYVNGCHLCALLWVALVDYGLEGRWETKSEAEDRRKLRLEKLRSRGGQVVVRVKTFARNGKLERHLDVRSRANNGGTWLRSDGRHPIRLEWRVDSVDELHSAARLAAMQSYTGSEESLGLATAWLRHCSASHEQCQVKSDMLPTRLVDVGSSTDRDVRVVVSAEDIAGKSEYLALSHCWGGLIEIRLLKETYNAYRNQIAFGILPQNFQDAVSVTRKLGFRYIWIDSLCIIQDSSEDWIYEAAQMARTYSNAVLSIAAVAAPNSKTGCFARRMPLSNNACRLSQLNVDEGAVFAVPSNYEDDIRGFSYEKAPLHERAWVLQERLLAPRTLSFGISLFWECRSMLATESKPLGHGQVSRRSHMKQRLVTAQSERSRHSKVAGTDEFAYAWDDLLDEYTSLKLSFARDKHIAIMGFTSAIENRTGLQCVAGLWKDYMVQQLCWSTTSLTERTPPQNRAPSWSWINVDGQVVNLVTQNGSVNMNTLNISWLANVERTFVNPSDPKEEGRIMDGEVIISGQLLSMKIDWMDGLHYVWLVQNEMNDQGFNLQDSIGSFKPDSSERHSGIYEYLPLCLLTSVNEITQPRLLGLVLVPTGSRAGEFKRIGFAVYFDTPVASHDRKLITII